MTQFIRWRWVGRSGKVHGGSEHAGIVACGSIRREEMRFLGTRKRITCRRCLTLVFLYKLRKQL
jgi:hypothetical protein